MAEINAKPDVVKKQTQDIEYTGTMEIGMAILASIVIAQIFMISLWVLNDHNNPIIFFNRVAPKFIFDSARSLITLGFALFWM